MPGAGDYGHYTRWYTNISGDVTITAATDDTALVAGKTNWTLYVQKAHVQVTGASAGKTWQLTDTDGAELTGPFPTDTDGSHYEADFGPKGVALTEGKGLNLDVSAAGASGRVSWEGYRRLTAVAAP